MVMTGVTLKRFTVDEYHRLIELGFFDAHEASPSQRNQRVELVEGNIIQMAAKGTPHTTCNTRLLYSLLPLLGGQAIVRHQDPISIPPDSEPEPDFAIVRPQADYYSSRHPGPGDVFFLIEVSDSTLAYDQGTKLSVYGAAKIPHYWIVNLVDNVLEQYSDPYTTTEGKGGYLAKRIALSTDMVQLPVFSGLQLDLATIFAS